MTEDQPASRVMLLTSPSTYRAKAFLEAADHLGLEVLRVTDLPRELAEHYNSTLAVQFAQPEQSADYIEQLHRTTPVSAILSVDDAATELAAIASERIGLPANNPKAALASRDKHVMRNMLREGGVKCPDFQLVPADSDPYGAARQVEYPCVIKPLRLSGSRGVIRANNPDEFVAAFQRVQAIISESGENLSEATLLVEQYLPGVEVAVEGLLTDGELKVLAIFDKPDPLEGPFFEETIYTTPSRLPQPVQQAITDETAAAARALGLRHGPIHAELRVNELEAWLLEIAGRSIGGL